MLKVGKYPINDVKYLVLEVKKYIRGASCDLYIICKPLPSQQSYSLGGPWGLLFLPIVRPIACLS